MKKNLVLHPSKGCFLCKNSQWQTDKIWIILVFSWDQFKGDFMGIWDKVESTVPQKGDRKVGDDVGSDARNVDKIS